MGSSTLFSLWGEGAGVVIRWQSQLCAWFCDLYRAAWNADAV